MVFTPQAENSPESPKIILPLKLKTVWNPQRSFYLFGPLCKPPKIIISFFFGKEMGKYRVPVPHKLNRCGAPQSVAFRTV